MNQPTTRSQQPTTIVVLISGNGSNLQAILDACASSELNAQVVAVISNKRINQQPGANNQQPSLF